MPMEPDLYRALRAKDLRRVRDCLRDWGNENRRVWWTGGAGSALTPLHVASKGSSKDILQELLRHPEIGRSINTFTDKTSVTPLHEAAGSSTPEVIRLLLDAGANLTSPSGDLSTAFHIACSRGRVETCVELLRRGSLLEGRDAEGMTPLLRAAANGRADVTQWLLSEGADPAAVDINENTALALSCRATSLDPAKALLDGGADATTENAEGYSCVALAAISGRTELLDMMLSAMASSGQRFRDGGGDVLYEAVDHGLWKVVELLTSGRGRELGVNINRPSISKQATTPLHAACFRGQYGIVGQLLSRGAEPNVADANGLRALHVACALPDSKLIVKSLVKAKADANVLDSFGCSPLYYAFARGNDDIVHLLLSRGGSLFRMDYDQALRIACFYGMIVEVESLLWMEAEPSSVLYNHRDRGTAFHSSVNPAVRDGINRLLAESSTAGADGDESAIRAAKEAAAAWGGAGAMQGCESPCGTTTTASSASSGWTTDSSRAGGGTYQSSSVGSEEENSSTLLFCPYDDDGARARGAYGLAKEEEGDEADDRDIIGEDDEDDDEDDAFLIPSMFSLENDLVREADSRRNSLHAEAAASMMSMTGTAAAMRRWGQRVRGGATGNAGDPMARRAAVADKRGSSPTLNAGMGLEGVKERARAKIIGVMKWASSPRSRGGCAGGRARGFAG